MERNTFFFPFLPPSNKVGFANGEFTASLQVLSELPASIWTGGGMFRSQIRHRSALFSGMISDSLPVCPLLSLPPSLPLLLWCQRLGGIMSHAHTHTAQTPVMQYDLFSYQLLTLSTISDSCWHQHSHMRSRTHTQAKVSRCAPAVSR